MTLSAGSGGEAKDRRKMDNTIKTTLLLGALTGLFILIGDALGGSQGMIYAFAIAIAMNFGSYWFSDKIVLAMYRAREVDETEAPQFHAMIEHLCKRANLPKPKIYIIPSNQPNAFATGRDAHHAAVAATDGILRMLTMDELEGVMGHELAHVKHHDILISSVAATIAGAIVMLAQIARFGMMFGGYRSDDRRGENPFVALLMLILAPVAASIVQMAISRSREYAADRTGAEISGNPQGLADALRKLERGAQQVPMSHANPATAHMFIVNPFSGADMAALFSTHPKTEERIARLEEMAREMDMKSGDRTFRRFL
jgi:heat shock protein HtpX